MTILFPIALVAVALAAFRGRVLPLALTMWGVGVVLAGMFQLDQAFGTAYWVPAATGGFALLIGYASVARYRVRNRGVATQQDPPTPSVAGLAVFEVVLLALVATHFLVTGVPLFSSNVEVARFQFGSTLLFGLPGRAYLFGLPFLVILSSAYSARYPSPAATRIVRVAWGAFAVAQVLTGTKGALLGVLVMFVLVRSSVGRPFRMRDLFHWRPMALGSAGVALAFFLAFQYSSLQLSDPGEAVSYFEQRVTIQSAQPGYVAMTEFVHPPQPYLIGDLLYTIQKYTGQAMSDTPYSLDMIVSAKLIGLSPEQVDFLAPVTIGAFAGWYLDVGWAAAVAAMLALGAAYGLATYRAAWSATPFRAALWGFATYLLSVYAVNGSLVYWAVNGLLMATVLTVLWGLTRGFVEVLSLDHGRRSIALRAQPVFGVGDGGERRG